MIKNYTPHTINIYDVDGETLLHTIPSNGTIRVPLRDTEIGREVGIPVMNNEITGDIEWRDTDGNETAAIDDADELIIVSFLVKNAAPSQENFRSPGPLLRNAAGQPIGCIGWRA